MKLGRTFLPTGALTLILSTAAISGCSGSPDIENTAQLIAGAQEAGLDCIDARAENYRPDFAPNDGRYEAVACGHAGDDPSSSYFDMPEVGMYVAPSGTEIVPIFCGTARSAVGDAGAWPSQDLVGSVTAIVGPNWVVAEELEMPFSPSVDPQGIADALGGEVTTVAALCAL